MLRSTFADSYIIAMLGDFSVIPGGTASRARVACISQFGPIAKATHLDMLSVRCLSSYLLSPQVTADAFPLLYAEPEYLAHYFLLPLH